MARCEATLHRLQQMLGRVYVCNEDSAECVTTETRHLDRLGQQSVCYNRDKAECVLQQRQGRVCVLECPQQMLQQGRAWYPQQMFRRGLASFFVSGGGVAHIAWGAAWLCAAAQCCFAVPLLQGFWVVHCLMTAGGEVSCEGLALLLPSSLGWPWTGRGLGQRVDVK